MNRLVNVAGIRKACEMNLEFHSTVVVSYGEEGSTKGKPVLKKEIYSYFFIVLDIGCYCKNPPV